MSVRGAVVTMVAASVVGGCLLLVAWRSDVKEHQRRAAPPCAPGQVFTRAMCRAEADGTITGLTEQHVWVDVDGRHLVMSTTFSHGTPDVEGRPVRVTLLRGEPVHLEGVRFTADSDDTPANDRSIFFGAGLLCLVAGFGNLAKSLITRRIRA